VAKLDVSGYNPGNYRAVAQVKYEAGEVTAEDTFRLGELRIEILNYTQEFERDELNSFIVDVESLWNDPIRNVYANFSIVGGESALTPSIDLDGFTRGQLTGFIDTTGTEGDEFQGKITVFYGEGRTEKTVDLGFKKGGVNYIWVGGIVLGVLVLAFVVWVIVKLKKLEKKSGKKKKK